MITVRILENNPYNSLMLHYLNQLMTESIEVKQVQVLMGTTANKSYLKEIDFYHPDIKRATSNDLIVIADVESVSVMDQFIEKARERIQKHLSDRSSRARDETSRSMARKDYLPQREGISPFFLRDFTMNRKMGKVHSVFQSSFNLEFDTHLLNFSTKEMSAAPHGCLLDKEKIQQVLQKAKVGELVKLENKTFTFYTRGDVFTIAVSNLEAFDLAIPFIPLPKREIKGAVAYQLLEQLPFKENIGLKEDKSIKETIGTLLKITDREKTEVRQAIRYLIGRGDGLTPSGDDLLLGYTMVRQAFNPNDSFLPQLKQVLETISTTAISQAYYESLFAGYVNSLFLALLFLLDSNKEPAIKQLLALITRYGHTSGYDTLYGCYLGLQSLIREEEKG